MVERGKRMGDKDVPFDAAKQAVRIAEIEGVLAVQQAALRSAVDNMSSTLQAVQAESRQISQSIHDLALAQATNESDRQAITRLEGSFAEMNKRLESWFDDMERQQASRWAEHETYSSALKRELDGKIHAVSDTVKTSRAWAMGVGSLLGVVVAGAIWMLDYRFDEGRMQRETLQRAVEYNRTQIDAEKDRRHKIELHLARGGQGPYVPQQEQ